MSILAGMDSRFAECLAGYLALWFVWYAIQTTTIAASDSVALRLVTTTALLLGVLWQNGLTALSNALEPDSVTTDPLYGARVFGLSAIAAVDSISRNETVRG